MAPIGNTSGTALKDPDERQRAYKNYCAHLAEGYPKAAWSYRNGEYHCTYQTIESYMKINPLEFDPFLKEEAHSNSYKDWFDQGRDLSGGKVMGNPSPQTWATIMRNMFSWDREDKKDVTSEEQKIGVLDKLADAISAMRHTNDKESPQS